MNQTCFLISFRHDYTVNPKEDEVEAAFDIVKHIPKLEEMEEEVEATVQLNATNKAQKYVFIIKHSLLNPY